MVRVNVGLTKTSSGEPQWGQQDPEPAGTGTVAEQTDETSSHGLRAVANLSRSGLTARVAHPFCVGDLIHVRIAIKHAVHELQGRVVRTIKRATRTFDVVLEWTNCSPQALTHVDGLLRLAAATNLADRLADWNLQPRRRVVPAPATG